MASIVNQNNNVDKMDIRGVKIQVLQDISKRLNIFNNAERVFYKGNSAIKLANDTLQIRKLNNNKQIVRENITINEQEQLLCIMEICGRPPTKLIEASTRKKLFFENNNEPRIVPNSRGRKRMPGTRNISSALKCNDPLFVEFLEGDIAELLIYDHELSDSDRINIENYLMSKWGIS